MEKLKKKIIFAGMPDMGLICLDRLVNAGVNIVGIIPPKRTDKTYQDFMRYVEYYKIPVIDFKEKLDEPEFIRQIKDLNADLGIVCSYNHKFPPVLLNAVKGGFINVHPSLLPDYRGPNPYSNVIINNEKETGVTFHYMDERFDTGDVVAHSKINIDKDETMGTIFAKLNELSASCLIELLKKFETVDKFEAHKQPSGLFKYAKNYDLALSNTYIDWSKTPEEIDRFVRALNPFIGAYTKFNQEFLRINSVRIEKKWHKDEFGKVCAIKDTVKVAVNGGYVHITSLQYGSYVVSDSLDFIKRSGIKKGDILNNG